MGFANDHFVTREYAQDLFTSLEAQCESGAAEQRWYPGGHVTAFLNRSVWQKQAAVEALERVAPHLRPLARAAPDGKAL